MKEGRGLKKDKISLFVFDVKTVSRYKNINLLLKISADIKFQRGADFKNILDIRLSSWLGTFLCFFIFYFSYTEIFQPKKYFLKNL